MLKLINIFQLQNYRHSQLEKRCDHDDDRLVHHYGTSSVSVHTVVNMVIIDKHTYLMIGKSVFFAVCFVLIHYMW